MEQAAKKEYHPHQEPQRYPVGSMVYLNGEFYAEIMSWASDNSECYLLDIRGTMAVITRHDLDTYFTVDPTVLGWWGNKS